MVAQDNLGAESTGDVTAQVSVTPVNDAPLVVVTAGSLAYTEGDGAVVVNDSVGITDVDDTNLESATVAISANYVNGEDTLSFTDQNGITGSWDSGTGVLTLTGTSSVANYQAALQSITYTNSSDNPNTATRTVSFTVNDGQDDSASAAAISRSRRSTTLRLRSTTPARRSPRVGRIRSAARSFVTTTPSNRRRPSPTPSPAA